MAFTFSPIAVTKNAETFFSPAPEMPKESGSALELVEESGSALELELKVVEGITDSSDGRLQI